MRVTLTLMLLVSGNLASPIATAADAPAFPWPQGQRAAVSLAYDDALDSQLDHAVPALNRHGFKGSFYLTLSNPTLRTRLAQWRAVAAAGHELGNHTLFHQCSGAVKGHEWVASERDLDTTLARQMRDQVLLANTVLSAIDGRQLRTFTVPCGDVLASGKNYIELIRSEFVAVRLGDGGVVDDMWTLDPYAVPVDAPIGLTGAQLIERVEQAARQGTMVDIDAVAEVFASLGAFNNISSMMVGTIKAMVYLGMAILVAWKFGIAAIVVGVGLVLLFRRLNLQVRTLSRASAEQMGALSGTFVQSIQAFKYLAATDTAEPLRRVALAHVERAGDLSARLNLLMAFTNAAREPIAVLVILSIVMVQLAVLQQPLAPIMVSILLFYRGVNSVLALQNSWQSVLAQIGAVEIVRDEFARLAQQARRQAPTLPIGASDC